MKNKKKRKVMLLVLLLLGISIGFAALATTLKINGTTGINSNTWNVYWENKSVNVESVTQATPTLSAEQGKTALTIATWSATLNLPGDFYEFTINAVNAGTIDAMISEAGVVTTYEAGSQSPSTLPSYISYTVTYEDGTPVAAYHLLSKKSGNTPTKEAYKVRVEFLDTITPEELNAIPEGGYSYTFTTQVQYVQADSNAIDSHPAPAPTYVYDGNGAATSGNGGETEWVDTLNPEWKAYLRFDGTKIETCGVYSNGTVCLEPNHWASSNVTCDNNDENCTATGYVASKKAEFEAAGATCSLSSDGLTCHNESLQDVGLYDCQILGFNDSVTCFDDGYEWDVYSDGSTTEHAAPSGN